MGNGTIDVDKEINKHMQQKYCLREYIAQNGKATYHIFPCKCKGKKMEEINQRPCCNAANVNSNNVQRPPMNIVDVDCMTPDDIRRKCAYLQNKERRICANCVKTFYHNEND